MPWINLPLHFTRIHPNFRNYRVKCIIMNEQFSTLYVFKTETTKVWPLNTFSFIKIAKNLDEDKYSLILKYISGQFLSI